MHKHIKPSSLLLPLLLLFFATSCHTGYNTSRFATIYTTTANITFPADTVQSIIWFDADDTIQTISPEQLPSDNTSPITLTLPTQQVTPILVFYKNQERPSGCIYPLSTQCTPLGGWAAHLLYQFLRKTKGENIRQFATQFNWKKLMDAASRLNDPWQLDEEAILTAISEGSFDTSLVTRPKSR